MAKNCALYVAKNCAVLLAEKCVLYLTIYNRICASIELVKFYFNVCHIVFMKMKNVIYTD